jgi:pimeloyl-ACP methyl ester carboxylesterase
MISRCQLLFLILLPLIATAKKVNGSEAVPIGGIKQWIKFQGENDQAPVLLFIHGGPGNSAMGYADTFTKELQKQFIVVLWDQRESGHTVRLNKSPTGLSVSIFISDAIELIDFLRAKFSKDRIYLMGHSWGGYLGLRVAAERPELISAYFAISPMINQLESERLSLGNMKEKAKNEGNAAAIQELDQVEVPFKNAAQLYYHRKWLSKLMNSTTPTTARVNHWALTWLKLFNEASQTNFFELAPSLHCAAYFLIGRNDYQTHFSLTETYYLQVVCKEKKLYWFEDSAHNPHLTEPVKFQKIVIDIVNQN